MFKKFQTIWDYVRTSLWFVPLLMSVGAAALAGVAIGLEFEIGDPPPWWLHSGNGRDATELLATLLGSLFTTLALALSITMVVLSLATNALGPRLVRNFIGDTKTQVPLGLFIASIFYIVLVLRMVDSSNSAGDVPHFAVTLGTVLSTLSIFALLFFVHHLARSIVADVVIERVGAEFDNFVRAFPEIAEKAPAETFTKEASSRTLFALPVSGYVQAIDADGLVTRAAQCDAFIQLPFRPGHHLLPCAATAEVRPANALDDELKAAIISSVIVGPERTPVQDLEYAMNQIVEIALRALSPGINDPFTAITAIDRLSSCLAGVMGRLLPSGRFCDDKGVVRLTTETSSFAGLVAVAFNRIRQAAEGKADVLIGLVDALLPLLRIARTPEQAPPLLGQLNKVVAAARRSIREPGDLRDLEDRLQPFKAISSLDSTVVSSSN